MSLGDWLKFKLSEQLGLDLLPKIGIDIGSSAVKLLYLTEATKHAYTLKDLAVVNLPFGAVVAGKIENPDAVVQALRQGLDMLGLTQVLGYTYIPASAIIAKILPFPKQLLASDKLFQQELQLEADKYFPYPLDEISYDYVVLNPDMVTNYYEYNDRGTVPVWLITVKRDQVAVREQVCAEAGILLRGIEIEQLVLQRALSFLSDGLLTEIGCYGVLDLGATQLSLSVFAGGLKYNYFVDSIDGDSLLLALQDRYAMTLEQANIYLSTGLWPEDFCIEVIVPHREKLIQQIVSLYSTFLANSDFNTAKLDCLFLTGGLCGLGGLVEVLSDNFGVKAIVLDSVAQLTNSAANSGKFCTNAYGLRLLHCIGSALWAVKYAGNRN